MDAHLLRIWLPISGVALRCLTVSHPALYSVGFITARMALRIALDSEIASSQSDVAGLMKLAEGFGYICDILWFRIRFRIIAPIGAALPYTQQWAQFFSGCQHCILRSVKFSTIIG